MPRPINLNTRCTPVADWPEIDKRLWAIAQDTEDPFDPNSGYARRWKPATLRMIESGYGRWLGWLERSGLLVATDEPADRVTRERVAGYLEMLRHQDLADYSVAQRLQQLTNALKAITWGVDWKWLQLASSRIHATALPVRDKVGRMQPVDEIGTLGSDLMTAADHDRFRTPCDRATLFRDGLILAFLVHRPIRLGNLTGIAIDRHLYRQKDAWWLRIPADETKGGATIFCAWPANLAAPLERYLDVHRPVLLSGAPQPRTPTDALWVSRRGGAMGPDAIYMQVTSRTKEQFGKAINPHLFRHTAATAIATVNPEGAPDIMQVLGHASMRPSEKHYNRAKMVEAGTVYQATIARLRNEE